MTHNKVMKNLIISEAIQKKLSDKHNVSRRDVEQCFKNKCGLFLLDDREDHKTNPPTLWFVAPTNCGRMLKIILVYRDGSVYVKSAYDATQDIQNLYDKFAK